MKRKLQNKQIKPPAKSYKINFKKEEKIFILNDKMQFHSSLNTIKRIRRIKLELKLNLEILIYYSSMKHHIIDQISFTLLKRNTLMVHLFIG